MIPSRLAAGAPARGAAPAAPAFRAALLAALVVLPAALAPARAAAHEPAAMRDFGDALLDSGDHYRAIGAYKAYLFLAPEAADRDLVAYRISLAYLGGEQLDAASVESADLAADDTARPEVRRAAWLLGGRALYDAKRYGLASEHLRRFLTGPGVTAPTEELAYAHYLLGWTHLRALDTADASRAFGHVPKGSVLADPAAELSAALAGDLRLPWRSPFLAGLLSVVLPGAGHMYVGQWGTGISALTWNGVFIWGAVEAFRAEQWGLFALMAVLESLWYGGTIYGAAAGAHRYNRDALQNLIDDLAVRHPTPDAPPAPGLAPGFAVSVEGRF